ncbi:MAG: hypothetical protein QW794_08540 [Thermosphaera sp.]
MRDEKRRVVLSVKDDAVVTIDKFILRTCVKTGESISRSMLITRLVEALASALESNNYDVEKIEIRVVGRERSTTAVIYVRGVGCGVLVP